MTTTHIISQNTNIWSQVELDMRCDEVMER